MTEALVAFEGQVTFIFDSETVVARQRHGNVTAATQLAACEDIRMSVIEGATEE
jgi:hypothetical protein